MFGYCPCIVNLILFTSDDGEMKMEHLWKQISMLSSWLNLKLGKKYTCLVGG